MRKEYDFSKIKSRKNPYAERLKRQAMAHVSEDKKDNAVIDDRRDEPNLPYDNVVKDLKKRGKI